MTAWKGQSKGSPLGYKIFIWILNNLGLSVGYFFSKIVGGYFYFSSMAFKKVLNDF